MSKSDLAARPIYHHTRESIEAHLTIVFAALAVSRWIENDRMVDQAFRHDRPPLPHHRDPGRRAHHHRHPVSDDLQAALDAIHCPHQLAQVELAWQRPFADTGG